MERLSEETHVSDNGRRISRNIWYGSADITAEGEYGLVIKLDTGLKGELCKVIKRDLAKSTEETPTETNWYFFGRGVSKDCIGTCILPAVMVRECAGKFVVNLSLSDYDFCECIDAVLLFKSDFEYCLNQN